MTLIDTLVGLAIALLILKAAISLAIEIIQAARSGTQLDLRRHTLWLTDHLDNLVQNRQRAWVLSLVHEGVGDEADLVRQADMALSTASNPLLREFGQEAEQNAQIKPVIDDLVQQRVVARETTHQLSPTESGRRLLHRSVAKYR